MTNIETYQDDLNHAWNTQLATSSLERWLDVCAKEGWHYDDDLNQLLISIFGASWYFTRFIFYRGDQIFPVLNDSQFDFKVDTLKTLFSCIDPERDVEARFEQLRILKNETMLRILIANLTQQFDQSQTENALSCLAEASFAKAIEIFFPDKEVYKDIVVLAMGRMAGYEMTFGSDLDMVFLSFGELDEKFYKLSQKIMSCMRKVSYPSSEGMLYEVDTRLRPHGNSGTLITRFKTFHEFHLKKEREIWEKQMMTRCRRIFGDEQRLMDSGFGEIIDTVYNIDNPHLLVQQVYEMRIIVEEKLGTSIGKYDMKKGKGGLMDIDFISHYLQLLHGKNDKDLRTCSTRQALTLCAEKKYLQQSTADSLLNNYEFLKQLETRLRLFDMKPIDTIEIYPEKNITLSRAMGFGVGNDKRTVEDFLEEYRKRTGEIREAFLNIVKTN